MRSVYQNPLQPDNVRMKAAAIAIEYELPRLAVTATINSGDFAEQLDRANEQSRKIIEAQPLSVSSDVPSDETKPLVRVSDGHKPSVPDRRFRRW